MGRLTPMHSQTNVRASAMEITSCHGVDRGSLLATPHLQISKLTADRTEHCDPTEISPPLEGAMCYPLRDFGIGQLRMP